MSCPVIPKNKLVFEFVLDHQCTCTQAGLNGDRQGKSQQTGLAFALLCRT